ncbi:DUF6603 domain-containing protein [Spongiimicrobium salis]|uniref:DUF6603 domain-containing protein n=1 Tax=Spongiimicrobium salis TaxID=1667022 RepID=UPI00374D8CDB
MSNVLHELGKGFSQILEPVKALAEDEHLRRDFLRTLGHPLGEGNATPDINLPPNIFDEVAAFGDENTEDTDLEKFYELLEDILKIVDAMESFIMAVKTEHPDIIVNEMLATWLNLLLLGHVRVQNPGAYVIFEALGIVQEHAIHYGGIYNMFGDSGGYLNSLYDGVFTWDTPEHVQNFSNGLLFPILGLGVFGFWLKMPFQHGWEADPESNSPIADAASLAAMTFALKGKTDDGNGNKVKGELVFSLAPVPRSHGGPGMLVRINGSGGLSTKFENSSSSFLKKFKLDIDVDAPDILLSLGDLGNVPGSTGGGVSMKLVYTHKGEPLFGNPNGTHFKLGKIGGEAKVSVRNEEDDYKFKLFTEKNSLVIKGGDGFLSAILPPEGLKTVFDLAIGYSKKKGFFIEGGAKLFFTFPIHKDLGPLRLNTLMLGIKAGNKEKQALFALETSIGFTVTLGPVVAVVDQIGLEAKVNETEAGGSSVKFKPPNGVGISVDAKVVKGGGYLFFDPDNERYAGALQLKIFDKYVLTAIGLITTRLPDGEKGFSMLLLVSLEFEPAIQLGMGFSWGGIGLIIGYNRSIQVEALRAGIKNNTLDHILFPENVIANISQIISDLRAIFPPKRDQFVIGLMAKINWGVPTLLTIELGLVVEFKNPVRLAILGVIKAALPDPEKAVLILQVNFLGIIDFENKELSFDASIFNSRLLAFTLEGDMALRISWGEQKDFLLSVGGFHPSFTPPARYNLGNMKRITLSLLTGNPKLTLTNYFAITSNTVQFGAAIDFLFKISKFRVVGYLGFDVLFQFSPFRFIAGIRAGIEVRLGSRTLFAIGLEFELAGPEPWSARGTAKFKILFFSFKVRFNKNWGNEADGIETSVSLLQPMMRELEDQSSWTAVLPARRFQLVSLKEMEDQEGVVRLAPMGSLRIQQKVMPFEVGVSKYGQYKVQDISMATIKAVHISGIPLAFRMIKGSFAPSNYKDMEDDDKLKSPSFVEEKNGVQLSDTESMTMEYAINRPVTYEVRASDFDRASEKSYELSQSLKLGLFQDEQLLFGKMSKGGAIANSPLSRTNMANKQVLTGKSVQLGQPGYTIVNTKDLVKAKQTDFTVGSKAEADDRLKSLLRANPSLRGTLQVVPEDELELVE